MACQDHPHQVLPPEQNFLGLSGPAGELDSAGVVLMPVPFEATSTFGRGSAGGPAAILQASRELELFDAALGFEPWRDWGGIATLAPLTVEARDGATLASELAAIVDCWLAADKFVVTVGGEHTSIVGAVWAHGERHPDLTVVQFDAHADLRSEYAGSAWNHACTMARVRDRCPRIVQVGIRSQAAVEREITADENIPVLYAHRIHLESGSDPARSPWLERLLAACGPRVYVTFDCDVFDPAVIPATGTPEPGGLTWSQVEAALAILCREREVVGFDLSELAPVTDLHHPQFTAAKLIYRFLGHCRGRGQQPLPGSSRE
ncbi:MAG: agmatinase [bacterium]